MLYTLCVKDIKNACELNLRKIFKRYKLLDIQAFAYESLK